MGKVNPVAFPRVSYACPPPPPPLPSGESQSQAATDIQLKKFLGIEGTISPMI